MATKETTPLQFDLIDLPDEGKDLTGEATPAQLELEDEDRRSFQMPVRFHLHLSPVNSGHDLLVQGMLQGQVRVICDRCDEAFDWNFSIDDVCHEYENAFGKTVDLTEQLREDILLSFPQHFLCSDECQGLCPRCGANLNDGPCGCEEEQDGNADRDNPWAALDGFVSKQ